MQVIDLPNDKISEGVVQQINIHCVEFIAQKLRLKYA